MRSDGRHRCEEKMRVGWVVSIAVLPSRKQMTNVICEHHFFSGGRSRHFFGHRAIGWCRNMKTSSATNQAKQAKVTIKQKKVKVSAKKTNVHRASKPRKSRPVGPLRNIPPSSNAAISLNSLCADIFIRNILPFLWERRINIVGWVRSIVISASRTSRYFPRPPRTRVSSPRSKRIFAVKIHRIYPARKQTFVK
jgi:hypothetical protein